MGRTDAVRLAVSLSQVRKQQIDLADYPGREEDGVDAASGSRSPLAAGDTLLGAAHSQVPPRYQDSCPPVEAGVCSQ